MIPPLSLSLSLYIYICVCVCVRVCVHVYTACSLCSHPQYAHTITSAYYFIAAPVFCPSFLPSQSQLVSPFPFFSLDAESGLQCTPVCNSFLNVVRGLCDDTSPYMLMLVCVLLANCLVLFGAMISVLIHTPPRQRHPLSERTPLVKTRDRLQENP